MDVMEDNLYSQYNDTGFSWALTLSTLPIVAVAFPGMFMNIALVWVTITKSPNQIRPRIYLTLISVICASYCAIFPVGFYWFNNIDQDTSDYKTAFIQIFTHTPLIKTKISPNNNAATGHSAAINRLQIQQRLTDTQNVNQIYPIPLK
uniref:G_PROTEIN_RECEP_F1_2 domain-containing protein n=1 Tax=Meloidogyne javanica TaxID=6303 RepID=A0A915LN56_MELJA